MSIAKPRATMGVLEVWWTLPSSMWKTTRASTPRPPTHTRPRQVRLPTADSRQMQKYTADSSAGKGISLFLLSGKTCLYNATNSGANLTSWIDIPHKSEAVSNHHHPDLTFICLFRICRRPLVVWVRSPWQLTQAGPPSTSTRRESTTTTDAPVQGFFVLACFGISSFGLGCLFN